MPAIANVALTSGHIGRPTSLTPEVKAKILGHLAKGNYIKPSVEASGVAYSTFRQWIAQGEQDRQQGLVTLFTDLLDALAHAQAEAEAALVARLEGAEDWRAQSFLLERRHRERWGKDDPGKQAAVVIQIQPADAAALVDALSTAKRTIPAIDAEFTSLTQPSESAAESPDKR